MKRFLGLVVSLVPLFLFETNARSADLTVPAAECGITGFVEGGGGYQGGKFDPTGVNRMTSGNFLGLGETAVGYGCRNWMAQVDGAFYYDSFSNNGALGAVTGKASQGHIGGAVFWRDPAVGRLGLAGSEIFNNAHFVIAAVNGDIGGSLTRVGAFGDLYAGEMITLGGGAFYVTGNPVNGLGTMFSETGFQGNLHAKLYATPNLSIGLQGDLQTANYTSQGQIVSWNGVAGSGEAEYLLPDTALSLFVGGRVASRNLGGVGGNVINEAQGFIGVKWAFGGPVSSLQARDRSGTYDNTSVFDEKLPGYFYDAVNALTN